MRHVAALVLAVFLGLLAACGGGSAGAPGASSGASKPAAPADASAGAATGAGTASGAAASSSASAPAPGALSSLIAAAANEGVFQFYASSALGKAEADRIIAGFNQKYGLNIEYQYTAAGSMTRDTARVITEISAGQPPTWDLMMMTDAHYAMLFSNGVLDKVDWAAIGAQPRSIAFDGTSLMTATTFVAPAYNPNIVRPEDAPKDWNDILDPRWRGKIGVSTATHYWARLAQGWGDERTTRFVEALGAQQPVLGSLPDLYTRLTIGELAVYSAVSDSYCIDSKATGAPFVVVETAKPIIAQQYNVGLLKGVRRPNQAKLMALFMLTPEGQGLWEEIQGQTSMYIEGTTAYRYAQSREVLPLDPKFGAEQLDQLTEKYGRLIGYR